MHRRKLILARDQQLFGVAHPATAWQIGQFATQIKDNFDWVAVPTPCGDVTCSPMPGGAGRA
jgi:hypothetical protein